MPSAPIFSRRSVVAACNLLADRIDTHDRLVRLAIDIGAENLLVNGSIPYRMNAILMELIRQRFLLRNEEGEFISDELVRNAARDPLGRLNEDLVRALARDGFTINEDGQVQNMLPSSVGFPQADDEVTHLLDNFGMAVVKGHLQQATDNHARAQWASANAQLRTFLEGLFDEIAVILERDRALTVAPGEARRSLLAHRTPPFLLVTIGEWGSNGKNFVNGVFKRLHGEGPHPGLSDAEDCTFRLHLALLVARLFLRRLKAATQ